MAVSAKSLCASLLDLGSLSSIRKLRKYLNVKGFSYFAGSTIPLTGGPELWRILDDNTLWPIFNRAVDDPDASLSFRRTRNASIVTFSLETVMQKPKAFFFLADHRSLLAIRFNIYEDVISQVFEAPQGYDGIIQGMVYLIHFIMCASAYRVTEYKLPNVDLRFDVGYSQSVEELLMEAVTNANGQWGDKGTVYKRVAPFLEMAMGLESLARCLVDSHWDNTLREERVISRRMFHSIYQYTNEDHLVMNGASRNRLSLGLLVLAFVERDFLAQFSPVLISHARSIVRSVFRLPAEVNVKDLVMAIIVISDFAQCHEDAEETLTLIIEHVDESARLARGVLGDDQIPLAVKRRLDIKWRRQHFLHELHSCCKFVVSPAQFISTEGSRAQATNGPWSFSSYIRYESHLASSMALPLDDSSYTMADMGFTRRLLSSFLPWFLHRCFTQDSTHMTFLRPKLSRRPDRAMESLAKALRTGLLIGARYQERIYIGEPLLTHLQGIWRAFGAENFSVQELHCLLFSRDLPGQGRDLEQPRQRRYR